MRSLLLRGAQILRPGGLWSPLDALAASLYAAYGLRRLVSAWTGPLVTVRRDSDNATADLYPDATGRISPLSATGSGLTLAAWCGSASAYVTQWWDQTGNGRHATQSTAAAQPRLVNAGVIETMTGVAGTAPGILFDGSDDALSIQGSAGFGRATDNITMAGTVMRNNTLPARQFLATAYSSAGGGVTLFSTRVADGGSTQIFCRKQGSVNSTTFNQTPALTVGTLGRYIFRGLYIAGTVDITVNSMTTSGAMVHPGQTEDLNGADNVKIGEALPGRIGALVLSRAALPVAALDAALSETLT